MFQVTILGSSAALPMYNRHLACQVLQAGKQNIMIDCGEGSQFQCQRYGTSFHKLDMILISHLHGDHFYGLIALINNMHMVGRTQPLYIFSPPDLADVIRLQLKVSQSVLKFELHFTPLPTDSTAVFFEDETLTISTIPLQHRIKPCNGFLLREKTKPLNIKPQTLPTDTPKEVYLALKKGQNITDAQGQIVYGFENYTYTPPSFSYAYCSDTIYDERIVPIVEGIDLLYHEATFLHEDVEKARLTYHTTARQAAQIAQMAGVKQLLIGHISARYSNIDTLLEEAQAIFPNTLFATEGNTFTIDSTL